MKYLYFLFLFVAPVFIQAQCIADAGPDQHGCSAFMSQNRDTLMLGGQPTASGGTAPYTYSWSFHDSIGANVHVYASDFLNDTTIANPEIFMPWENDMTYILKVTDANNQVCYDTVVITSSIFVGHLGQYGMTVNAGDTITFLFGTNISSNRPVKSYLWRPNHGMIDSTSLKPTVAPTKNTNYYVQITDSAGCTATGGVFVFVVVDYLGIDEKGLAGNVEVFPNPVTDVLEISLPDDMPSAVELEIVNASGKKAEKFTSDNARKVERQISLPSGLYFLKVIHQGRLITSRRIIVKH